MSPNTLAADEEGAKTEEESFLADDAEINKNNYAGQHECDKHTECDLDAVLSAAGEFGRYQQCLFLAMLPFALFFAFVLFVQMFVTTPPQQYWCRVPDLRNLTVHHRRRLSIPRGTAGFSRCEEYAVNWTALLTADPPDEPDPTWCTRPCSAGWEFDHTDIPYATITTELGWVCERDSYATVAQAIFFVGSVVGGILFGWIADRYGRIPALVGCNLVGCVGGVLSVFAADVFVFSACRFLVGLSYDNCFMMMYIIALEYVGARYRTRVANMSIALFFGLGCVSLPWLALWIADWRRLLLYTSLPMLIACAAPWCVPESVRWLLLQGRTEQAVQIVRRIASVNGKQVPDKLLRDFQECGDAATRDRQRRGGDRGGGVRQLLRRPRLRRMLALLVVVYVACAVVFDALVRLSDALGLDFFLTFTLTSATEMPSVTLLTLLLDRWGRRWLAFGPMMLSALACIVAVLVPAGVPSVSLAITARFCINMSYNAAIQWSAELLPTGARAGGTGLVHIVGYVATMLSPWVVYLGNYVSWLPLVTLAVVGATGAVVSLLLPETMGEELPQSFEDGENLIRAGGIFSRRRTKNDSQQGRELQDLAASKQPRV